MGRPYSFDLRVRVVAAITSGMSCRAAAERYGIGESTAIRWARRTQQTGSPAALPSGGKRPFALAGERDWILARLAAKPDITLRALLAELHERGIDASYFAVWHIVARARISFKKNTARQRTGSTRRRAQAEPLAAPSGQG